MTNDIPSQGSGQRPPAKENRMRKPPIKTPVKPPVSKSKKTATPKARQSAQHFVGYGIFGVGVLLCMVMAYFAIQRFSNPLSEGLTDVDVARPAINVEDLESVKRQKAAEETRRKSKNIVPNSLRPVANLDGYWTVSLDPHFAELYIKDGVYQIIYGNALNSIRHYNVGRVEKIGNTLKLSRDQSLGVPKDGGSFYNYIPFGQRYSASNIYIYNGEYVWDAGQYEPLAQGLEKSKIFTLMNSDIILWSPYKK